ncbi:anti-sigma factor [Micromonospora sp. NBC_01796]|uniref:anti-sigma factor n=1 Tax=Micromonospora sp. NBC_01796 TaxID=2975987 RepID=UPI002DDC0CB9|nr:zf-HC2 domain-containing protein [Micromonospora sp. NBC_01796]WSA86819.1 zf-HC2 domain-containing protein [Micromonospora sp. NBC_01796]
MSRSDHFDVASYALGVLDEEDTIRFEEHLADCWACAGELESMLPVVDLLAEVDRDDLAVMERATADDTMVTRALTVVGRDRRRARSQRILSLAAGVVVVALLSGLALVTGANWVGGGSNTPTPSGPVTQVGAPPWTNGSFPDVPNAEKLTVTDKDTGVRADLLLDARPFGTQVSFALRNLTGPRVCRLVVLRKNGDPEVLSSWTVPTEGYGTPARPEPLLLQSTTSAPRADIDRMQIQALDDKGAATALVTIPL